MLTSQAKKRARLTEVAAAVKDFLFFPPFPWPFGLCPPSFSAFAQEKRREGLTDDNAQDVTCKSPPRTLHLSLEWNAKWVFPDSMFLLRKPMGEWHPRAESWQSLTPPALPDKFEAQAAFEEGRQD